MNINRHYFIIRDLVWTSLFNSIYLLTELHIIFDYIDRSGIESCFNKSLLNRTLNDYDF